MKRTTKLILGICTLFSMTAQAQTSWYEVPTPVEERLNDIEMVNGSVGYIAGEKATLLKSTDGGFTWSQMNFSGIPAPYNTDGNFLDLEFTDENNGFLIIENHSAFYRTTDGGTTWEAWNGVDNSNQCFRYCIKTMSTGDWFIGGAGCFQSGMITWQWHDTITEMQVNYETFNPSEYVTEMDFDSWLGLAAMNGNYMLRSNTGGLVWDTVSTGLSGSDVLTSVFIASNGNCYAGYNKNGGGFGVLYSADNGLTWQEDVSSATFYYPAYYGFTENSAGVVYAAAVSSNSAVGLIFEQDGNGSWNYYEVDQPVYAMDNYTQSQTDVTFAVGDSGYVVVNVDPQVAGMNEATLEALEIYPNPASDEIQIHTSTILTGKLRILSDCGSVVKEIAGSNENIYVGDLPSGVYFVEAESETGTIRRAFVKR